MAKSRQKMKKNDIVIYVICGTARRVKILSGSVDLAYKAGQGFKILLPDGGKIYASDKNLFSLAYYKDVLTAKKLRYIGIQNDENNNPAYVLFNTAYNATLAVNIPEFSSEKIDEKVRNADKKFKIEASGELGTLRVIKSTAKRTQDARTPDEAYNTIDRFTHERRTEAGQGYIIPLCKKCKTPACYICGFCKNLHCTDHFCIDKSEAKS
jgi:hypothetical protein